MNINVEHQPNCRAVAHVRVPADQVGKERDEIITYVASMVRLPGYRPGKTPKSIVAKRYENEVKDELEKKLISDGLRQAVKSEGLYGFDPNVWAGMPVRTTTPGSYEVITGYEMDDFAKSKIAATNKELVDERGFVAEML
jgi:hypothetical protein